MTAFIGWPLGLFLSAVSSVFGILGKIFLKLAHNHREREEEEEARARKGRSLEPAENSRVWFAYFYAGLFSMLVLNPALAAAAYCFATQSLLAPMAGLTIGWNTLMGPILLPHERLTTNDFVGAVLIFAGCVLVGVSGTHETPILPVEKLASRFVTFPFLLYCAALLVLVSFLIHHAKSAFRVTKTDSTTRRQNGMLRSSLRLQLSQLSRVSISVLAGVTSGQLFFLAALMRLLHDDAGIWRWPITYVCIVGAIGTGLIGLYLLNASLKVEDAVVVIYLYEASYILSGAISGLCFFRDMKHLSAWHYVVYSISLVVILLGIYVVAKRTPPQNDDDEHLLPLLPGPGVDNASAHIIFQRASYYANRRSSSPTRLLDAMREEKDERARRKSLPVTA